MASCKSSKPDYPLSRVRLQKYMARLGNLLDRTHFAPCIPSCSINTLCFGGIPNALDDCSHSADLVAVRDGQLLHSWWIHPHLAGVGRYRCTHTDHSRPQSCVDSIFQILNMGRATHGLQKAHQTFPHYLHLSIGARRRWQHLEAASLVARTCTLKSA